MADQEVIKHTKKILGIWKTNGSGWHKVKEFTTEILIIVFAVTISIWLHSWSEHRHEQAEVKQFLIGLRADLEKDIKEMQSDKDAYAEQTKAFGYLNSVSYGDSVRIDSLRKYANLVFNQVWLVPNAGRFEGFKASGKIGSIENYELQTSILDLYQEDIPSVLASTSYYIDLKKQLTQYINTHRKRVSKTKSNITSVMVEDEVRNISSILVNTQEIRARYDSCVKKMEIIKALIDEEFGPSENKHQGL